MLSILQLSGYGAILILFIMIVRAMSMKRLPKRTFVALWGIAAVRLLLPFSLPSQLSIHNAGRQIQSLLPSQYDMDRTVALPSEMGGEFAIVGNGTTIAGKGTASPFGVLGTLWIAGAIATAVIFIIVHIKQRKRYLESLPVIDHKIQSILKDANLKRNILVRYSELIATPLTYGISHPVILLPKPLVDGDRTQLRFVLTHELIHIRRFDVIKKMVLVAAVSVHWFNPFVWIMFVLANRDLELACDESVLQLHECGSLSKKPYAEALLALEAGKGNHNPLVNGFSKNATKERIVSIMKYKKLSIFASVVALLLISGTVMAFATTPKTEQQEAIDASSNDNAPYTAEENIAAEGKHDNNADTGEEHTKTAETFDDSSGTSYQWSEQNLKTLPDTANEEAIWLAYDIDGTHTGISIYLSDGTQDSYRLAYIAEEDMGWAEVLLDVQSDYYDVDGTQWITIASTDSEIFFKIYIDSEEIDASQIYFYEVEDEDSFKLIYEYAE